MSGMQADGKTVLVIGVFDLFHRGHVELLKNARALGDRLVVVINGDAFTSAYKRKPIFSEDDRLHIVQSLKVVDVAVVSNSPDVKPFIEQYGIDLIVHGDDWDHASYLRQICVDEEYLKRHHVEMAYLPYYQGLSTSGLIGEIRSSSS